MNVTARFESAEAIPGLCTLAFAKPLARATLAAFTIAGPAPGAAVVPPVTTSTSAQMVITDPVEFTKFAGHAMAHKRRRQAKTIRHLFESIDGNHDGTITFEEFTEVVCGGGDDDEGGAGGTMGNEAATARQLFDLLDKNGSGAIARGEMIDELEHDKEAIALAMEFESLAHLLHAHSGSTRRGTRRRQAGSTQAGATAKAPGPTNAEADASE